jgi:hypothetical protein
VWLNSVDRPIADSPFLMRQRGGVAIFNSLKDLGDGGVAVRMPPSLVEGPDVSDYQSRLVARRSSEAAKIRSVANPDSSREIRPARWGEDILRGVRPAWGEPPHTLLIWPLVDSLAESDARPASVLIGELDAGGLQSSPNSQVVGRRH